MHTLEEILAQLRCYPIPVLNIEKISLQDALGRILAKDIISVLDVPGFDCSAMDGYAIAIHSEVVSDSYQVIGYQRAGKTENLTLTAGSAVRIFTGAPLPAGCDCVIPQENVKLDADSIQVTQAIKPGEHMRLVGSDIRKGDILLEAHQKIQSKHLGLLASQGIASVDVFSLPRVGVLSVGDELQTLESLPASGHSLGQGYVVDVNRPQLLALLNDIGVKAVDLGCVLDQPQQITNALEQALSQCDMVISSGGASVGDADYMYQVVSEMGEITCCKVAMKPGKPFAFGHVQQHPMFILPGNPLSAVITFMLMVQPFILRAMGLEQNIHEKLLLPLVNSVQNTSNRRHFVCATLVVKEGLYYVEALKQDSSAGLFGFSRADILIDVPPNSAFNSGEKVTCWSLQTFKR